jgi:DNA-binding transcriptional MerR regulator
MELYTIAEMSKLLKIPESTARYYRDRHPEYFHYTGKGREKRYLPETDQKKEIQGLREEVRELKETLTVPLIKRLFRKNKNV